MKPLDLAKITTVFSKQLKRLSIEESAMVHPFIQGKLLTQGELDALHKDIKELGKTFKLNLTTLPPHQVPALSAQMPKVAYKTVRVYEVTSRLNSLFRDLDKKFIPLDDDTVVRFADDMSKFVVSYENASYEFNTPDDLLRHLTNGKKAYLHFQFREGFVKWVTETEGNLRMAWINERDEFAKQSSITVDAFRQIEHIKKCAVAHEQQANLNKLLPFKWTAATRPARGGLSGSKTSLGDGLVANTVVHLLVKEDIKIGRLSRLEDDYLCSQSKGKLSRDLGPYIAEMKVEMANGDVHTQVPQEITCQNCLEKLETIKNKVKTK